jgi:hypothetical protein
MSSQREVSITGNNNTRVKVTGQEELLVRVNSVDLTTTGLAKESTLQTVNTSLNNIESALTGTFTVTAKPGSLIIFPYNFPTATFRAVTLIVPVGQTIELDGTTLPAGTYNFSGEGSQTCNEFTLSNPSATPSGIILLTVE